MRVRRGRSVALPAVALALVLAGAACSTLSPRPAPAKVRRDRVGFMQCPVSGRDTLDRLIEKVRGCILTSQTGWLQGAGWSPLLFESVPIVDNPLDNIETTGPIALLSENGQAYWVNHVALELAGITPDTRDPPGGRIGRFPGTFVPNGILYGGAMEYIDRLIPRPASPR